VLRCGTQYWSAREWLGKTGKQLEDEGWTQVTLNYRGGTRNAKLGWVLKDGVAVRGPNESLWEEPKTAEEFWAYHLDVRIITPTTDSFYDPATRATDHGNRPPQQTTRRRPAAPDPSSSTRTEKRVSRRETQRFLSPRVTENVKFLAQLPPGQAERLKAFLWGCLHLEVDERWNWDEVVASPFYQQDVLGVTTRSSSDGEGVRPPGGLGGKRSPLLETYYTEIVPFFRETGRYRNVDIDVDAPLRV